MKKPRSRVQGGVRMAQKVVRCRCQGARGGVALARGACWSAPEQPRLVPKPVKKRKMRRHHEYPVHHCWGRSMVPMDRKSKQATASVLRSAHPAEIMRMVFRIAFFCRYENACKQTKKATYDAMKSARTPTTTARRSATWLADSACFQWLFCLRDIHT